ncbi:hypothetical protein EK904_000863 [Melospiza melodia maxima]|nr:hypothetical protein EK904_000863 [Melospiza melodia maxima]
MERDLFHRDTTQIQFCEERKLVFTFLKFKLTCDQKKDSWEIVEGLRGAMNCTQEPQKQEGCLLKKRKWPLKGWHKIERGKLHGCIDVGLSVMSVKKSTKCIDLDTEEQIYHLKVKSQELFDEWVAKLRHHRMYRQNEISMFPHDANNIFFPGSTTTDSVPGFCDSAPVYFTLRSAFSTISTEREKLKQMLEYDASSSPSAQIVGLKNALTSAIAQNTDLKDRLRRIHAESKIIDSASNAKSSPDLVKENSREEGRGLVHQVSNESRLSIADSLTEFFDAQEVLLSASSSENEVSDDDSYVSDISDNASEDNLSNDMENERQTLDCISESGIGCNSKRRTCLPAPCPNTSNISLWNILRNNIGKDLSKVAMPVELNEPLNTLQRLCEELEYSELLDTAAHTPNPFERMVYIAAFAVSAYASSYYRAGSKPFNPVLGETYECIREDKGFQFFAEQVSHHPPISACHAESVNFAFWQDVRWKNKFWGKSMEIVPVGTTHVTLPAFKDHFAWNKVTSCIHNILSGQRWIEHYGEIIIKNLNDDTCHCKLTFIKAKYWSPNAHEIEGSVMDRSGKVVHRLFGKWHESLYCGTTSSSNCIWRANPMPKDYEQWYGFTQFALELNELDPQTRFLEEGNIEGAEMQKQRIEQLQRERRKVLEENNLEHQPRFFRKSSDDSWVSNGTYMDLRKEPGFSKLDNPVLW